jgi:hypothetical protein
MIKFPVIVQHLQHKHGGRITRLEKIAHTLNQPKDGHSQDVWYFVGSVEWRDGGKSDSIEIAPWALCADHDNAEAKAEIDGVLEALNEYLHQHGEWRHGGKVQGWIAYRRNGERPVGCSHGCRGRMCLRVMDCDAVRSR